MQESIENLKIYMMIVYAELKAWTKSSALEINATTVIATKVPNNRKKVKPEWEYERKWMKGEMDLFVWMRQLLSYRKVVPLFSHKSFAPLVWLWDLYHNTIIPCSPCRRCTKVHTVALLYRVCVRVSIPLSLSFSLGELCS